MASEKIIYYDFEFIKKFEKLKDILETEDKPLIHRFLIDNFGFIFQTFQHYAKVSSNGVMSEFEDMDEAVKRELIRPLSRWQYRMVERSFSVWQDEDGLVIWSIWDYLHDNGLIYDKEVMSIAEVCCCSLILENVYKVLAREN